MTPRSRSSALSCETRFTPPRTLNAPTGWWFSCLTKTSAPSSSPRAGTGTAASGAGVERYGAARRARRRACAPGARSCVGRCHRRERGRDRNPLAAVAPRLADRADDLDDVRRLLAARSVRPPGEDGSRHLVQAARKLDAGIRLRDERDRLIAAVERRDLDRLVARVPARVERRVVAVVLDSLLPVVMSD